MISWAVAAPDGAILGQGFIQPTRPISEEARAIHGITDEQVEDAPTFAESWLEICSLLAERVVFVYNAAFDEGRILASFLPYGRFLRGEPKLRWFCGMEAFAACYGDWHGYFRSYTWKTLEVTCAYFSIPHDQVHTAAGSAYPGGQRQVALCHLPANLDNQRCAQRLSRHAHV